MTLEHYPGMTERAIARIADQGAERWPLLGCTVIHRVGPMRPGENIVLVIAASAHRQAALDATAFLIDWLKTKAPFWKREDLTNGAGAWVDAREEDDAAAAAGAEAGAPPPPPTSRRHGGMTTTLPIDQMIDPDLRDDQPRDLRFPRIPSRGTGETLYPRLAVRRPRKPDPRIRAISSSPHGSGSRSFCAGTPRAPCMCS